MNKKLIIIVIALLALAGVAYWQFVRNGQPSASDMSTDTPLPGDNTRQETTEGQTINVPNDVPEDAITNYELITENDEYKIRKSGPNYLITLYAIINRPDQYEMYREQLREYKQNALDYLQQSGVDVNKVHIDYEPEEAKDL